MKTDNPVAAGIMMGVGSFLTSYVGMRMTMKEFNLDVEKFEEAKAQNASRQEIARRRIAIDERTLDLRGDELELRAQMPWLEIAAKHDAFSTDLANEVEAKQTLGKVMDGFQAAEENREAKNQRARTYFEEVIIPEERMNRGLGASGSSSAGGSGLDSMHRVTGIPYRTHNRAVDQAGRHVSNRANEDEGFNAMLNRDSDGNIDYSQLPPEAQDLWGRAFLLAIQAEDFDEARISQFFQRRGISTSVLTQFGINPAGRRQPRGRGFPGASGLINSGETPRQAAKRVKGGLSAPSKKDPLAQPEAQTTQEPEKKKRGLDELERLLRGADSP